MKNRLTTLLLLFLLTGCHALMAQVNQTVPHCEDEAFHEEVAGYVDPGKVPLIDVSDLYEEYSDYLVLDAREQEEFKVSHLPGAQYVGYNDFEMDYLEGFDRSTPVVVYCSIGYRSEKIARKLRDNGFTTVLNLYGSIFEWVNRGYPLDDMQGERTNDLHTYNKKWSRWVMNQKIDKIW